MFARTTFVLALALLLCLASTGISQPRNSRQAQQLRQQREQQQRQKAQRQLKQVKANLAAAQGQLSGWQQSLASAQSRASSSQARLSSASAGLQAAQDRLNNAVAEAETAARDLDAIEEDIEAKLPQDAPLFAARRDLETAREEVKTISDRLFSSDVYQSKYQKALASVEKVKLLAELQRATLKDSAYIAAKQAFERADSHYSQVRRKLYEENPRWQEKASIAQAVSKVRADAELEFHSHLRQQANAAAALRSANADGNEAVSAISLLNEAIKKLTSQQNSLAKKASKSSSGKK